MNLLSHAMREPWWSLEDVVKRAQEPDAPPAPLYDVTWAMDAVMQSAHLNVKGSGLIAAQGPPLPVVNELWAEATLRRSADVAMPQGGCPYQIGNRWAGVQVGLLVHTFSGELIRTSRELDRKLAAFVDEGTLLGFVQDADTWWTALLVIRTPGGEVELEDGKTQTVAPMIFRSAVSALGLIDGVWRGGKTHFTKDVSPRPGVPLEDFYNFHAALAKILTEALLVGVQMTSLANMEEVPPDFSGESRQQRRQRERKEAGSTLLRVYRGTEVLRSSLLGPDGFPRGVVFTGEACDPYPGCYEAHPDGRKVFVKLPYNTETAEPLMNLQRALAR